MTARVTFTHRAAQHERFEPHSWDRQIGKRVPVNLSGALCGSGYLVAATVNEAGTEVEMTVDLETDTADDGTIIGHDRTESTLSGDVRTMCPGTGELPVTD